MSINRQSDRPVYRQLADLIRDQIMTGALGPGAFLPGESVLVEQYRVGRETARQAVAVLRAEGFVTTSRRGSRVRGVVRRVTIHLGRGQRAVMRMPTEPERRALAMNEGVPVIEVHTSAGGQVDLYPGDKVELVGGVDRANARHSSAPLPQRDGSPASGERLPYDRDQGHRQRRPYAQQRFESRGR